jgi:hypothetical protein
MARTRARFLIDIAGGVALCAAAVALSPDAIANPMKTGGYACVQQSAGAVAAVPAIADGCAGAPVADMAGIPLALPGPMPAGAAAVGVPIPAGAAAGAAPLPIGAPIPVGGAAPVPIGAPVPVGAPVPIGAAAPVPVGAAAAGVPVPLGAAAAGAPVVAGAPILDMGGYGGKGAPTGPPPAGDPAAGQPILPGPTG